MYIVGGPGSGKSSLADALAARSQLTALHLDDHWGRAFEGDEAGLPTGAAVAFREELIGEQLRRESWIVEGAEPPFVDALAAASDLIVWCDVSFQVAAFRMIRRHVIADLSRSNRFPGYGRLWRFLHSVRRRYYAPTVADAHEWTKWTRGYVERAAPRYQDKLIRSRGGSNDREVGAVLGAADRLRTR